MRRLTVVIDTPRIVAACSTVIGAVAAAFGASWPLLIGGWSVVGRSMVGARPTA
jgi:hypothetical protein